MINARKELEEVLKEMGKKLQAAAIESNLDYSHSSRKHYLYANYTDAEYEEFMKSLDFEYDNEFGGVLLHGVLWFTDGTHTVREVYDGSEQWALLQRPRIPKKGKFLKDIWQYSVGGG